MTAELLIYFCCLRLKGYWHSVLPPFLYLFLISSHLLILSSSDIPPVSLVLISYVSCSISCFKHSIYNFLLLLVVIFSLLKELFQFGRGGFFVVVEWESDWLQVCYPNGMVQIFVDIGVDRVWDYIEKCVFKMVDCFVCELFFYFVYLILLIAYLFRLFILS